MRYRSEQWRTREELDARLHAIDARIVDVARRWPDRPVLTDQEHRQADAADRAAASIARAAAAEHRHQADRVNTARPGLLADAVADYTAARTPPR